MALCCAGNFYAEKTEVQKSFRRTEFVFLYPTKRGCSVLLSL